MPVTKCVTCARFLCDDEKKKIQAMLYLFFFFFRETLPLETLPNTLDAPFVLRDGKELSSVLNKTVCCCCKRCCKLLLFFYFFFATTAWYASSIGHLAKLVGTSFCQKGKIVLIRRRFPVVFALPRSSKSHCWAQLLHHCLALRKQHPTFSLLNVEFRRLWKLHSFWHVRSNRDYTALQKAVKSVRQACYHCSNVSTK